MSDSILEGYYNLNVDEFKLYENALYNNHNNNYEHEHEHEDDYAYHDEEEYFDAEFYLNNYDDHNQINIQNHETHETHETNKTQNKEYSIIDLVYYYFKQIFV